MEYFCVILYFCIVLLTVVQQNGCCNKCQQDIWSVDSVFMCGTYWLCYWAWPARSVSRHCWKLYVEQCNYHYPSSVWINCSVPHSAVGPVRGVWGMDESQKRLVLVHCIEHEVLSDLFYPRLSVLAKWLARKPPLRSPLCSNEIISAKPRLKSVYDFQFNVLFHCLLGLSCPLTLHNIFRTPMAR